MVTKILESDGDVQADRGESECPQCFSRDIVGAQFEVDQGVAQQSCHCSICSCEWTVCFNVSTIIVNKDGSEAHEKL